jgi:RecJ-like exonuclease
MAHDISTLSNQAAEVILHHPLSERIRVVSHYDADGISAAGILCTALYRAGYDFHATLMRNPFDKGFERLKKEKNTLIIFSDMGSGQIQSIEQLACPTIIIDHHQYLTKKPPKDIVQINANLCGFDGNYEACGASVSYAVAKALDPGNNDLAVLALVGAIGDKQHIGGFRGYNKEILDEAQSQDLLKERVGMKLYGTTIFDAVFYSIDPYYKGLSGNKEAVEDLFRHLHIAKDASFDDIKKDTLIRLRSFLYFMLLKAGCQQNILDIAIRKRYLAKRLGCELERFADVLDACGKNNYRGLGLSLCLNGKNLVNKAVDIEKEYRKTILHSLRSLESHGLEETEVMRYFYSDHSSLGGVVAGIATNYLFDVEKPLFSLARKEDELHISCRGTQELVRDGLDLGDAMKKVAAEVNGYGGGHKIAAGATVSSEKEQEFLEKVNAILLAQLKR